MALMIKCWSMMGLKVVGVAEVGAENGVCFCNRFLLCVRFPLLSFLLSVALPFLCFFPSLLSFACFNYLFVFFPSPFPFAILSCLGSFDTV
jgi:hypothetical protein